MGHRATLLEYCMLLSQGEEDLFVAMTLNSELSLGERRNYTVHSSSEPAILEEFC